MDMGVARSGLGDDRTMQVVGMVVMVVVDRQARCVLAEQLDEGRVAADLLLSLIHI